MPEIKLQKRYKYAGDIMPKLLDIGFDLETASDFLNSIPDADVVPKSEVDEVNEIIANQRKRLNEHKRQIVELQDKLEQAKTEVAREIFEEIEKILNDDRINIKLAERGFLFVQYGEPTFEQRFAELKKKYTEEKG